MFSSITTAQAWELVVCRCIETRFSVGQASRLSLTVKKTPSTFHSNHAPMIKLEPPESHHVSGAIGWLELGNLGEALTELNRLPERLRECPEALVVRWEIEAKEKDWVSSLETARKLIAGAPKESEGWVKQSYSLHELKRTQEAWDSLWAVAERFPKLSIIPYNLACYACQLGDHVTALQWLTKAFKLGTREQMKEMALKDTDLQPLRGEIEKM